MQVLHLLRTINTIILCERETHLDLFFRIKQAEIVCKKIQMNVVHSTIKHTPHREVSSAKGKQLVLSEQKMEH